jgi:hypothetical protein
VRKTLSRPARRNCAAGNKRLPCDIFSCVRPRANIAFRAAEDQEKITMLTASKFALVAAIVLGATFSASAATKARVAHDSQATASDSQATAPDVIPGYGKDGGHAAIPNPDR